MKSGVIIVFALHFPSRPFCKAQVEESGGFFQVAGCTYISSINDDEGSSFKVKRAGFEAADMPCTLVL